MVLQRSSPMRLADCLAALAACLLIAGNGGARAADPPAAAPDAARSTTLDPREGELRRHMAELTRAWETGDRALAGRIYADDFIDIALDGARRGKCEVLDFILPAVTPAAQIKFATSGHQFVFPARDVALVTYRNRDCRQRLEGERCFDFMASETFLRRRGQWQLVAGQQSMIPADPATARREVLAIEAVLRAAQLAGNAAIIRALHAENYRLILADGRIIPREKWVADVRTGAWKPDAIAYSEQEVRVSGDTAIVTGIARSDWHDKQGAPQFARERYTDVYAERYGAWRKLSTHLSCLEGGC
ncbi:hypothetical protein IP88_02860 [alpha proteobacterium AAP81b]|nr:hypothetical protein IP88_02860 [alpha proteobacterium AAP81b]